jgi:hypothetical protein
MTQYIKENRNLYKVVRETKAYYFTKELIKQEVNFISNGVTFMTMGEKHQYIKYFNGINEAILEHKIFKKSVRRENMFNEITLLNQIKNKYYYNGDICLNYNQSNFKNNRTYLKSIYDIMALIYSLNSDYILKLKQTDERTNDIYINLIDNLKSILTPDKFNFYFNMIKTEVEEPVYNGLLNIVHSVLNIMEIEEELEIKQEQEIEIEIEMEIEQEQEIEIEIEMDIEKEEAEAIEETEEEAEAEKKQFIINGLTEIYKDHINIIFDDKPTYERLFNKYLKKADIYKNKSLERIQDFIFEFLNLSDDME